MKKIAILGSTGSIGTQTLEVIDKNKSFIVSALSANTNIDMLEKQTRKYNPKIVCIMNENLENDLKIKLSDVNVKVVSGMKGLLEIVTLPEVDIVLTAVVGMIGVLPTIEAIKACKTIALANKETLVTAGHIIMPLAKSLGVKIIPVDSEHSAIFQLLEENNEIEKILLTASGGPFRGKRLRELEYVILQDALKHPNWQMGKKITIDCATMANKGLEVIEAKWLFNMDIDSIEVIIHPESIIHSMVQYKDGAVIAQLGVPDMKLPIQYALTYPYRKILSGKRLNFFEINKLTFEEPNIEVFKALKLAYMAGRIGGSMPTVFNAANEELVYSFISGQIGFLDIQNLIEEAMGRYKVIKNPSVEDILNTEMLVRQWVKGRC